VLDKRKFFTPPFFYCCVSVEMVGCGDHQGMAARHVSAPSRWRMARLGIEQRIDVRSTTERQPFGGSMHSLGIAAEALLAVTVSVPWERPVHAARLAFLRRVAHPGEVSVHVACGTDRLGFIDVACGLSTILTDVDAATLDILAQQFADVERRLGRLAGSLQLRQLAVEALAGDAGFPAASVHHLTLQNLFNAHLHPAGAYPGIIDALLRVIANGGSYFITESEAAVLTTRARLQQVQLSQITQVQGYYDEQVLMFQVHKPQG
jgi:hypothetical protein